jgi:hypothetical protein
MSLDIPDELVKAFEDYRAGRLGSIPAHAVEAGR